MKRFIVLFIFILGVANSCQDTAPTNYLSKGFIGAELTNGNNPAGGSAVFVKEIMPDFPAGQAGLLPGDMIQSIAGVQISNTKRCVVLIKKQKVGSRPTFHIRRAGKNLHLKIEIADREEFLARLKNWKQALHLPDAQIHPLGAKQSASLHSMLAEKTIVYFYASWCGPCKLSLPDLKAAHALKKTKVIGLTREAPDVVKMYQQKNAVPFQLARLEGRSIPYEYMGERIPRFFLLEKTGRILDRGIGLSALARISKKVGL